MSFDKTVLEILENIYTSPSTKVPMQQGKDVNFTGPMPSGFLGGGVGGIGAGKTMPIKIKKRKLKKKVPR
jgi:hypothetical protein